MTKQEWQKLYYTLDKLYREFLLEYHRAEYGNNAKTRKNAQINVDRTISTAKRYIYDNSEAYIFLVGNENLGQASAEIFDEMTISKWFNYYMEEYLKRIEQKIKDAEE